jgi:peroxiredoxin
MMIHPLHTKDQTEVVDRARLRGLALVGLAAAGVPLLGGCGQKMAPASEFLLLDGSKLASAQLAGKVALVNFWATSCVSCVAEMPKLADTHQKFAPRGYETLAVAMAYDRPEFVTHFATTRKLPFKVAFDHNGAVAKAWGDVKVTPTTYLVDKAGQIAKTYVGMPDFGELHATIDKLLKA